MSRFFEALERAERARAGEKEIRGATDASPNHVASPLFPTGRVESDGSVKGPLIERGHAESPVSASRPASLVPADVDQHIVSLVSPSSFESDQYRTLRHIIEQKRIAEGMHVVAITSAGVGDGKTLTSINLAGALAQASNVRVLLMDVDLRRPSVCRQLGIHDSQRRGIVDAVLDKGLKLEDITISYQASNLFVVSSGSLPSPPYEILKSNGFRELLEDARSSFDFILLDTPPIVPFSDCRLIGRWVDGFLIVVFAHKTFRSQFEEGVNVLEPEKVVGIVFNCDDNFTPSRYKYYQYEGKRGRRSWYPFKRPRA